MVNDTCEVRGCVRVIGCDSRIYAAMEEGFAARAGAGAAGATLLVEQRVLLVNMGINDNEHNEVLLQGSFTCFRVARPSVFWASDPN